MKRPVSNSLAVGLSLGVLLTRPLDLIPRGEDLVQQSKDLVFPVILRGRLPTCMLEEILSSDCGLT